MKVALIWADVALAIARVAESKTGMLMQGFMGPRRHGLVRKARKRRLTRLKNPGRLQVLAEEDFPSSVLRPGAGPGSLPSRWA